MAQLLPFGKKLKTIKNHRPLQKINNAFPIPSLKQKITPPAAFTFTTLLYAPRPKPIKLEYNPLKKPAPDTSITNSNELTITNKDYSRPPQRSF
ncbi:hypothetical protein [Pseudomonas chlororaphis]|uniref:hypothetical protein n=1 Tax=Pseudomonas chlororaphis TaxID=587753 RepID=UPI00117B14A0|nr:hypothetical protein [Pseudomonas chlororaphis]